MLTSETARAASRSTTATTTASATSGQNLANVIAHNGANGVTVESGVGNAIVRNSLYDNGGLGIDLGADGTTANDGAGRRRRRSERLQNGPEINGSRRREVAWDLETERRPTYRLEFFASDACDPSGSGEAQTHLETLEVNTDANGDAHDWHPDHCRGRPAGDDDRHEAGRDERAPAVDLRAVAVRGGRVAPR